MNRTYTDHYKPLLNNFKRQYRERTPIPVVYAEPDYYEGYGEAFGLTEDYIMKLRE